MAAKNNKTINQKWLIVVGARPNFVKVAPLFWELKKHPNIKPILVHTGQHYDYQMSQAFFDELDIPAPDYNLGIGSGLHGNQTGLALIEIEKVLTKENPDVVIVIGDVNSTLAGALAAAKMHIPVAHIEAGLRSFDKTMPEEINRVLTDHISNFLFCPTKNAVANLKKEGITKGVFNTGDIMFDILKAKTSKQPSNTLKKFNIKPKNYLLLTIHRASNTDNLDNLNEIIKAVLSTKETVIFPIHPRTKNCIEKGGLLNKLKQSNNLVMIDPVGYLEMLMLEKNARMILTDSGGVQKEAFWHGVPCITLRNRTEWIETVKNGWNVLVGVDAKKIIRAIEMFKPRKKQEKHYGGGEAAKKIIKLISR